MILTEAIRDNDGYLLVPPRGNQKAKVMILAMAPGFEDKMTSVLLSGDQGNELSLALNTAGIPEDACWITSVLKKLPKKSKPSALEIEEQKHYVLEEIETIKPDLIIPLGAEAFKFVMGKNMKVGNFLGQFLDSSFGKVLPNYSPLMLILNDPTKRPKFQEVFSLAKKFILKDFNYDKFEYIVVTDPKVNIAILNHYMSKDMWEMGIDFEWLGRLHRDEVLYTFQYCCEPGKAVILDLTDDGKTENLELLNSMKVYLEDPRCKLLTWNGRAELKRLQLKGFNIQESSLAFDGMKAVPFFHSRYDKGLETGITYFTSYEPYYNELNLAVKNHKLDDAELSKLKFLEPQTFFKYAGGDACAHYVACKKMMEKFPPHLKSFYYNIFLPLSFYLQDIEVEGLEMDVALMEKMASQYVECFDRLKLRLNEKLQQVGVSEFNYNSAPQKKQLLFETLGLEPVYWTKAGKNPKPRAWYVKQKEYTKKQFSPSTNGKTLSTLSFELKQDGGIKYEIVDTLLNLNRVNVFANKFLSKRGVVEDDEEEIDFEDEEPIKQSYFAALEADKKIHADFYELLKNYRASSRPNVQNPASKVLSRIPEAFNLVGLETPENLRNIFYSRNADWSIADLDASGAEIAIAAYLSNDQKYIDDVLSGDFHVRRMQAYWSNSKLSKKDTSFYVNGKSISFRIAYTASLKSAAIPIQSEIFSENGYYIPLEQVEYALDTWNGFTDYMAYRNAIIEFARENKFIDNAYGLRMHFGETDNFGIQAGYDNETLSFSISSCLACYMWECNVKFRNTLKKEGIWGKYCMPINTIHDAAMWKIHKDVYDVFPDIAKHAFSKETRLPTGHTLGCGLTISRCWKDKNPIFDKETKWDATNGTWIW